MTEVTEKTGKIYYGYNTGPGSQVVWVVTPKDEKYILKHICRHSPDGFQWGYGGSGPADTALSILHDCVGKKDAEHYYQDFKWIFIAGAGNKLEVTEEDIKVWLAKKKDERQLKEGKS